MKTIKITNVIINLEEVSYISIHGKTLYFNMKNGGGVHTDALKEPERYLQMCYDEMSEIK